MRTVAAFTDTYLPTINGVSYTVNTWRDAWQSRGGKMAIVYPEGATRTPEATEFPVSSVPFPFYDEFRCAVPSVPRSVRNIDPEIVHAHTPFSLGLAARRLARSRNVPLVVSYHTNVGEYAEYISEAFADFIRRVADSYEQWFFGAADAIIAPSRTAAAAIEAIDTPVYTVSNGVDTELFRPQQSAAITAFKNRHSIPAGPLVGYTGRHGHEKRLGDILAATEDLEATVVIAGDGPARAELELRARDRTDVVFVDFLDRSELPTFYSALDAFLFPSPVETEGLVALESIACGTPVVAADTGALTETIAEGKTGTHFEAGDVEAFRRAIGRVLSEAERLPTDHEAHRERLSVEHSIDSLEAIYESVS